MTAQSSILAWKIPWMAEPVRLLSMGSQRVGLDWAIELTNSEYIQYIYNFIGYIHCRILDMYVRYLWLIYFMHISLYNSLNFHFLQGEHFLNSWVKRDLSVASGKDSDIFRKALVVYFFCFFPPNLSIFWSYTDHVIDHALITWISCTDHVADHTLFTCLTMQWSRGWSYTAHVTDHALITWLSCTEYVAEHALFTWLITHLSRDITSTDHVALMHWSRGWSYSAHVTHHAHITFLSCTAHVARHGMIT